MGYLYVGTKVVTATPQDKDGLSGYAVTYKDGYTSWSPKAAFEDAYKPLHEMYPGLTTPTQKEEVLLGEQTGLTGSSPTSPGLETQ